MLGRDPFDIAPAAQRPTRATWFLTAAAIVFAAASATVLQRSVEVWHEARAAAEARAEGARAQQRREEAARQHAADPVIVEAARARTRLQRSLTSSWEGLFGALENAGLKSQGHVSITTLSASLGQADAPAVRLSGVAASADSLLQYVEDLQAQRAIQSVSLTGQEPAQGLGAAPGAVRFQLTVGWEAANAGGPLPTGEAR